MKLYTIALNKSRKLVTVFQQVDFTLSTYRTLIETLQKQGFSFYTFKEFVSNPAGKIVVLRHDVDSLPGNSLEFARIQADKGIKGTYYFRIVPESFDKKIIKEIYSLGHEVGYHYENFVFASQKPKGRRQKVEDHEDYERYLAEFAIESFKENLEKLRRIVPIKTICMHGSPMSRWDSRLMWKYFDYHDFGIVGEPYFDVNFDEVLYLTDTGRRWDGTEVNIRDKATGVKMKGRGREGEQGREENPTPHLEVQPKFRERSESGQHPAPFPRFHSTFGIIKAAEEGRLPDKIMMTFHPQRWTDKAVPWMKELVWQNVKNVGKYFLVKWRN